MKRFNLRSLLAIWVAFVATVALADVKLPAIIGNNMVLQAGQPVSLWGWAEPNEEVTVTFAGQTVKATADKDGKWALKLANLTVGGPLDMTIQGKNKIELKNILVGEVWVGSGQSNMEWIVNNVNNAKDEIAAAQYPKIRLFTVKKSVKDEPQTDVQGEWVECSPTTVGSFSAVLFFFGRHLHKELNQPVGLIHTSWGGTPAQSWISKEQLEANYKISIENWEKNLADYPKKKEAFDEQLKAWNEKDAAAKKEGKPGLDPKSKPRAPQGKGSPNAPSVLFNGMVNGIIPFTIKGATWYQGESDSGNAKGYMTLLPTLIKDWRSRFQSGEFGFHIVQLANFMAIAPEPGDSNWAQLREVQSEVSNMLPNCGLGVAIDIGEEKDIHPRNKQDVGKRLALAALARTYGKDIPFSGPQYDSMAVEGNKIRLKFKYVHGGLVAKGAGGLKGFSIAGEDGKHVWADAVIDGETIVVSSDKVAAPKTVRYAWANNPICNLYNKAELPAVPFRTDNPWTEKK